MQITQKSLIWNSHFLKMMQSMKRKPDGDILIYFLSFNKMKFISMRVCSSKVFFIRNVFTHLFHYDSNVESCQKINRKCKTNWSIKDTWLNNMKISANVVGTRNKVLSGMAKIASGCACAISYLQHNKFRGILEWSRWKNESWRSWTIRVSVKAHLINCVTKI